MNRVSESEFLVEEDGCLSGKYIEKGEWAVPEIKRGHAAPALKDDATDSFKKEVKSPFQSKIGTYDGISLESIFEKLIASLNTYKLKDKKARSNAQHHFAA